MSPGFFSSFPVLRALARVRAALGHLPSRVLLGRIYETGQVPGRTIADANAEYFKAAEGGDVNGMWHFGVNHLASKEGKTDHEIALHWLARAAEGGHPMAGWALGKMYLAGKLVAADRERGLALLEAAAGARCEPARETLVEIYRDGRYGIAPDEAKQAHWAAAGD